MNKISNNQISIKEAEDVLYNTYNIKGTASKLPGYADYNFRIKVEDENAYILKISRPDADEDFIMFLQEILLHLERNAPDLIAPRIISDKSGNYTSEVLDEQNNKRKIRLLNWVDGRIWVDVNPRLDNLRYSLGQACGRITNALQDFDHPQAHGDFEWNTAQSLWTKDRLHLFNSEEKEVISHFQNRFEAGLSSYDELRKSVVHNDANDYNIIVSEDLINPSVRSIIDYGDAIHTQIINDVGIACAYAIMGYNDPLEAALPIVSGYHSTFPLQEKELAYLYDTIAMRLVVSYTSAVINLKKAPDNTYLQVSARPAWELLKKWHQISPDFAHYSFRKACGFIAHPDQQKFHSWAKSCLLYTSPSPRDA